MTSAPPKNKETVTGLADPVKSSPVIDRLWDAWTACKAQYIEKGYISEGTESRMQAAIWKADAALQAALDSTSSTTDKLAKVEKAFRGFILDIEGCEHTHYGSQVEYNDFDEEEVRAAIRNAKRNLAALTDPASDSTTKKEPRAE